MKLLFVHERLGAFGGAEANIRVTAAELQGRGHTLGLLYRRETGHDQAAWQQAFGERFKVSSTKPEAVVAAALERFEPDLVYLHTMPDLRVLRTLLQARAPLVRMVHDHELYCLRSYKYNYFTRRICTRAASAYCVFPCLGSLTRNADGPLPVKWRSYAAKREELALNRQCDQFVVYSQYSKQELVRNGFDPQRIHLHVPIPCWGTAGPVSTLTSRNLILFVGQIIRGKGVDVLLKALARLTIPFECQIYGSGNHRAYCERLCQKLGLSDRVQFRGYVPQEQLRNAYLEASVFAFSSVWPEPFGMAGPEAMRYGVPVVGFDAGGVREWLRDGENGFLVPWMDTQQFARRLETLVSNKDLARQMGRRGLEWVNREYEASRQVECLENVFLRLIDGASSTDNQPATEDLMAYGRS